MGYVPEQSPLGAGHTAEEYRADLDRIRQGIAATQRRTLIAIAVAVIAGSFLAFCAAVHGEPPPRQTGPLGVAPTAREIELGRKLFFDPRISANGSVSCATCHDPARGWSDGLPVAVGIFGQLGTRNSPTVINSSYSPLVFWDGRTVSTVAQALLPMSNPIEMGRQSEAQVVQRLRTIPGYVSEFAQTFGVGPNGQVIDGVRLARALAAFESTITSFNAPIDRYRDGDTKALTPDARIGYELFVKSNCMVCHPAPLYSDNVFHNTGVEFATRGRITDRGRASQSNAAPDMAAFKTPTLREIARSAPYMHNGAFESLERVVRHYNVGGSVAINGRLSRDNRIDPRIKPLALSSTQESYLLTFLREGFAGSDYPMVSAPLLP